MSHTSVYEDQLETDCGSSVDDQPDGVVWEDIDQQNDTNGDVDGIQCTRKRKTQNGHFPSSTIFCDATPRRGQIQPSSCSQTFTPDQLKRVKVTAYKLGEDIVVYVSSKARPAQHYPKPFNSHSKTLRRVVDELSDRHTILFKSMVDKLHIDKPESGRTSFIGIANEIFSDGKYNWGRIATLYAFAGWLAKYCVENNVCSTGVESANNACDNVVQMIGETAGKYVAEKLADWISTQGGWVRLKRILAILLNI